MKRKILSWIFVLLWMIVIFILSHQPAEDSGRLSFGLTEIIARFIRVDSGILEHIIRKYAHFSEYFILGILAAIALNNYKMPKAITFFISLGICVLYAVSDEIHQLYVPGRSGQAGDVLIDSLGGLLGILVVFFFIGLSKHKKE